MAMIGPQRQAPQAAADFETSLTLGSGRIELRRRGARLGLTTHGASLREDQARIIAMRYLAPGEQLLDAVNDDPSVSFTFVVWPRAVSHTGRLLDGMRAA